MARDFPGASTGPALLLEQAHGAIGRSCYIITTLIAPIHDRMLVVLEVEDWPVWLGE